MKKVSYKLKIIITIMIVFSLIVSYVNVIPADKKIETVAYKKNTGWSTWKIKCKRNKISRSIRKRNSNSRCFYAWN